MLKLQVPLLLLHGALDADVSVSHARDLARAVSGRAHLVILPNTEHEEIDERDADQFVMALESLITKVLGSQEGSGNKFALQLSVDS